MMAAAKSKIPWTKMKDQFRQLAKMFEAIETEVLAQGRLDSSVVDRMVELAGVSNLGTDVLAEFFHQSPKLLIQEEEGTVWLVKNPNYVGEEDEEDDG